jgi:hypothetical protein
VGYSNVDPGSFMLLPEEQLGSRGNLPTTPFSGLQMRVKAIRYEKMTDTTEGWLEMVSKYV